jgi:hypothetical protein
MSLPLHTAAGRANLIGPGSGGLLVAQLSSHTSTAGWPLEALRTGK